MQAHPVPLILSLIATTMPSSSIILFLVSLPSSSVRSSMHSAQASPRRIARLRLSKSPASSVPPSRLSWLLFSRFSLS
ncbi:hypothetical protein B0H19DRAFT_1146676 [Mycena capillaripes]|nr:hypothetical protein B0H19DRAFT_1146676 [Mycena capillaripes]